MALRSLEKSRAQQGSGLSGETLQRACQVMHFLIPVETANKNTKENTKEYMKEQKNKEKGSERMKEHHKPKTPRKKKHISRNLASPSLLV